MVSLLGWLDGITALSILIFYAVIGLFFYYESRKLNIKLLSYTGLMVTFVGLLWLGPTIDFFSIFLTGKNLSLDTYCILSYMWAPPAILCAAYIFSELMIPDKKRIFLLLYFLFGIIFEISLFLDVKNSFTINPNKMEGDLIDASVVIGSLISILLSIYLFSISFFLSGFVFKGLQSKGVLRKKYLLLAGGYTIFMICAALDSLITPGLALATVRMGGVSAVWFIYFGLREEPEQKTTTQGELKIAGEFFRLTKYKLDELYRLITENANDLITIFNNKFDIEYVNEKIHKKLLGYTSDDLIGKNISEIIRPDELKKIEKLEKEFLKKSEVTAEIRFRKKDDSYIWLEIKGDTFTTTDNETKILTISRDISAYKKAQKIMKQENIRLKKLEGLRKEFLARATHDIKNPLSSLLLGMEMLKELYKNKEFENFEELLEELYNQLFSVQNLAIGLLDFTMLEIRKSQLNKEIINISDIILKCVNNEKFRAKERGIKISCNLPEVLYLNGDELSLTQIFQNVIANAINYTPMYIQGKVKIKAEKSDGFVKISIKDKGIGLTPVEIKNLFTWDYKIKKYNDTIIKGAGFGLYISKQIVESHGGKIWTKSKGKNKGTTFIVELPIS